tara:strand:- start:582 stop:1475 length:894 start_codon:yes stop_codon:yes gene_type:complete
LKITNNFNLPETLVKLVTSDNYRKNSDYSVTEIIAPPRIQRLRRKHFSNMQTDVSDMLWQMVGTAIHDVAERSVVKNHINEERLKVEIDEVTLSGAIDVQIVSGKKVKILDYKFCGVYSVNEIKPEWESQLNIYGWLVNKTKGLKINGLQICAMLRDWSRKNSIVSTKEYPKAPIKIIDIPIWSLEKTEEYVRARIKLHKESKFLSDMGDELPFCTDEERWQRPTKHAVMKKGQKKAVKLFDVKKLAEEFANEKKEVEKKGSEYYVETRIGQPIRCTGNYCGVSEWCTQYSKESFIS